MIEFRHLRALVAIQRRGAMAPAARDLFLTQSALSHMMTDLESQLGQALFVRKTKPPRFTSAGLRLLRLAGDVLPRVQDAETDLQHMISGTEGRLLLAMECHSCFDWLLPTLEAYRKKHPQVEIDLRMGVPFDPYPALKDRRVDVILSTDPTNDPDVHFEPLFRYHSVLICAPNHRLAKRKIARPEDVEGETVIAYPVDEARLDFFSRFLRPSGVRPAHVRHAELTMMLVQLVASGQGIAALPSFAVEREVRRGIVVSLSLGKKGLACDLYAAVRAEEAGRKYMSDFFETARRVSFKSLTGLSVVPNARARGSE